MKTEFEKMRNGELACFTDPEILASIKKSMLLCARLRSMTLFDDDYREVIEELIPGIPESSKICPPFHCDHGNGIIMGEHVFINYNCTFLGGGYIRIGNHTLIGPNCQLYTPQHPKNYIERREDKEYAYPKSIGDDCWLGGNVTILPGVSIGHRCIVAAGSVVTTNVSDDCMVAGNPAVVKKRLDNITVR
ncbi:MAG: sugar O-acetyltransferase [Prolixibacteraceae bacterium]|nr:sugar O-acetyltransferase [Prolixibacteraceae bacterium]MBN2650359.1 sugar O-acetyltransferase [Prolixibacteraceae bacterium]